MKDITWELKNLDSLKEYIFDELIGEHKNTKDINEAINTYAERYHEMQLKLLDLHPVKYWTKTSGKTGNSKMHLSGDDLQPFCGLDTYYYEFHGKAIDISEKGLAAEYTQGTSVYQTQAYQNVPSEMICKKCLKRALAK